MKHVLHISVGPVQGFIAASRKTRDLQAGSLLLLEVVQKVANVILEMPGSELIFPAKDDNGSVTDAANVVVAMIEADPAELVRQCREAAINALRERWQAVRTFLTARVKLKEDQFDFELAKKQIESFLEFHAGWAPLGEDYHGARSEAAAMLGASKSLRAFGPAPQGASGPCPKSPLDALNESVIRVDRGWRIPDEVQRRLLLNPYETLDAISLIKRFYFGEDTRYPTFASTRTVAVRDLLHQGEGSAELRELNMVIQELNQGGTHVDAGTVLFDIQDDIKQALPDWDEKASEPLKERVRNARNSFLKAVQAKSPRGYFAVVLADGDDMGRFLGKLNTPQQHQAFSRALGQFASETKQIAAKHHAEHIYAGGDDVLALSPVSTCFHLARELHDRFQAAVRDCVAAGPTLSVAVAICPIGDDLRDSIAFAHGLEKRKRDVNKNALIVGVRVRSGTDRGAVVRWDDDPAEVIWGIQEAYQDDTIPRGFGQDVCRLADDLSTIDGLSEAHLRSEFDRLLRKKREGTESPEHLLPERCETAGDLRIFGELLAVGHFLTREGVEV